ncbi:BlaI/MecI/CopY family transcriptional regulator [candidate division KSB1 bacterium]|nr:BlaI/MecI/CopY family transcriptional regulator [candidate division KSB1 bacterium]
MPNDKRLTPVEWEIMDSIWKLDGSPSVREVLENAFPNGEKAYTTIQTVMNTLVKKNVLKIEKIGLVNFYSPTKSRDEVIQTEMNQIVSRVFSGSIPAMANYLFKSKDFGINEIEQIKKLLDQRENELNGQNHD